MECNNFFKSKSFHINIKIKRKYTMTFFTKQKWNVHIKMNCLLYSKQLYNSKFTLTMPQSQITMHPNHAHLHNIIITTPLTTPHSQTTLHENAHKLLPIQPCYSWHPGVVVGGTGGSLFFLVGLPLAPWRAFLFG